MMLPPARRLSRHVEPSLDGRRIDRVWAGIAARRLRTWSMRGLAVPAAAVLVSDD